MRVHVEVQPVFFEKLTAFFEGHVYALPSVHFSLPAQSGLYLNLGQSFFDFFYHTDIYCTELSEIKQIKVQKTFGSVGLKKTVLLYRRGPFLSPVYISG